MDDVLNETVDAQAGAATEASPAGGSSEATTEATPTPEISADVQALIDARAKEAAERVKAEYEGKDGHLAKLKSAKDKELARLKKQLREQQQGKVKEAKALLESNPDQAAQILLSLAEEQDQQIAQDNAQSEVIDWQYKILADLGADPAEDEEAAALVQEWSGKLIENPDFTYDFQQAAARLQLDRERKEAKELRSEIAQIRESVIEQIRAEVTRTLVGSGVIAAPTDDGSSPPKEEDWRQKKPSKLVKDGLAERRRQPIQRTQ